MSLALAHAPGAVAVGSTNPAKVAPVRDVLGAVFGHCRVNPVDVPSGVRAQPLSVEETTEGARRRAQAALRAMPGAAWGVGIEGGIHVERPAGPGSEQPQGCRGWLVTVAAIADGEGRVSVGEGMRLLIPSPMVARVLRGEELADVVDSVFGTRGARTDPGAVGYLTRGLVTRPELVRVAFVAALAPRLFPSLYWDSIPNPEG